MFGILEHARLAIPHAGSTCTHRIRGKEATAHAGIDLFSGPPASCSGSRTRGDRPASYFIASEVSVATPHTRGSTRLGAVLIAPARYPAHAGIDHSSPIFSGAVSATHTRIDPISSSSSTSRTWLPRTRGIDLLLWSFWCLQGHPAHAGMTHRPRCLPSPWLPRTRGSTSRHVYGIAIERAAHADRPDSLIVSHFSRATLRDRPPQWHNGAPVKLHTRIDLKDFMTRPRFQLPRTRGDRP